MKKILHISDIHVSNHLGRGMDTRKLRQLLNALLEDLHQFQGIDTVFITGDIAFSAENNEYEIFFSEFLNPLTATLGISLDRVVLTPGNHDSSRKAWKKTELMYRSQLAEKGDEKSIEEVLNELINDSSCERLRNFNEFRRSIDSSESKKILVQNDIFAVYEIDGVGIASANSSWLAYENDRNNLAIGTWQIKEIVAHIKNFESKVVIFHHPLDWLTPSDKKEVTDLLHQSKIKAIFFGHMHEFNMHKEAFFSEDSVLKLQAGRLDISKDDDYGGYSILNLHENNLFDSGEVVFRKFDYKKNQFKAWTDRAENGCISYSLDNTAPFDAQAFIQCCENKIHQFEYDLICNTGLPEPQRKKLSEVFIFPSLTIDDESIAKENLAAAAANQQQVVQIALKELKTNRNSFFILGAENSGKTTIAKRIVLDYLQEQAARNFDNFVFYLDFRGVNIKNSHQIYNQLLGFYTESCDSKTFKQKLEQKIESSSAVFIFDSIEKLSIQAQKSLSDFILKNKKGKYILFGENSCKTSATTLGTEISNASDHKLSFRMINIKGIQRAHVRELFQKWTPDNKDKLSRSLRQALKIVANAGMPNNAFVFTMLLSISERKTGSYKTYMHEADLVENFIEILLHKHVITTEDSPQYKDILLLLGKISEFMHKSDEYSLNENSLRQIIIEFNNLISQNFHTDLYLNPILNSGIIKKENDNYRFSQICFFNYAFANWLSKSGKSYSQLNAELDFIRFDKVIEYISALKKSDSELLNFLEGQLNIAWAQLVEHDQLTDLKEAETEISNSVAHDMLDILTHSPSEDSYKGQYQSEEDYEQYMDKTEPLNNSPVTNVKDSVKILDPSIHYHQVLSLYARTFRAAEHILDAPLTAHHFNIIVTSYLNSISYNVRIFDQKLRPGLIESLKNVLKYEGLSSENKMIAEQQIHAFINFVIAIIPNWAVKIMSSDFFNQRQLLKIERYRENTPSNLSKILLTYCLCELDNVDIVKEIKSLQYERAHESSSLLVKVLELTQLNFSLSQDKKDDLIKFLRKILDDRKNKQLFTNFAAISSKINAFENQTL